MRPAEQAAGGVPNKPRWRVWTRRLLKLALTLLTAIVVVVGIVLLLLHTSWGREQVRQRVEAKLGEVFAGEVSLGEIEGSLLSSFTVRDLHVADREGRPALLIGKLSVDYEIFSLWDKEVRIRMLAVDELALAAHRSADGVINLADLLADDDDEDEEEKDDGGGGSAWSVIVDRVELRGSVALHDQTELVEELGDLLVDASVTYADGAIDVDVVGISANWRNRDLAIDVAARFHLSDEATTIEAGHIAVGGARIEVADAVLSPRARRGGHLEGRLPVDVARALAPDIGLMGDITFSIDASRPGPEQPIAATLTATAGRVRLSGNASVEEAEPHAIAHLSVADTDLASIWRDLPPSLLAADIDIEATGSSLANLVGSATIAAHGKIEATAISELDATAAIANSVVTASVTGRPEGGHLEAEAVIAIAPELVVRSSRARFRHAKIQALVGRYVDVAGAVSLRASASGPIEELRVQGKASGERWAAYGTRGRDAAVDFDLVRRGDGGNGTVEVVASGLASGGTPLGSLEVDAKLTDQGRRARLALRSIGDARAHRVEIDGVVLRDDDSITANLDRTYLATRGLAWRGGAATLRLRSNGKLRVDGLALRSSAGNIDVDGDFALRGTSRGHLEVNARDISLSDIGRALQLDKPLRGRATVRANLDLRGRRTRGQVRVTGTDAAYGRDLPMTNGELVADLEGRDLTIDSTATTRGVGKATLHALARAPRSPLDFSAWARLDQRALRESTVAANITSLAKLANLEPGLPRSGSATLHLSIGDKAENAELEVKARDVVHPLLHEPAALTASAQFNGRSVVARASGRIPQRGDGTATFTLELPTSWSRAVAWERVDAGALTGAEATVTSANLDWWTEKLDLLAEPLGANGRFSITVEPGATMAVAKLDIEQAVGGPRSRVHATATHTEIRIEPHRTEVDVGGSVGDRRHLTARARISAGWRELLDAPDKIATATIDGEVKLERLPLVALHQAISATPLGRKQRLRGAIDASATIKGVVQEPTVVVSANTGKAEILGSRFRALGIDARYQRGRVTATINGVQRGGGKLAFNGWTDVAADDTQAPLSIALTTEKLDLGFVRMFAPELGVAGKLEAQLMVDGTRAKPSATGSARWSKGKIAPGAPLFELSDMSADITLAKTKLTARARGKAGRGTVDLRASVALDEMSPQAVDLTVVTEVLPIETETMILAIDTTTRVHGGKRGSNWELVADVDETIVHLPAEESDALHPSYLPDDLFFVDPRAVAATAKEPAPARHVPSPPALVKIHVRAPDTIEIRGQQASAIASVDLHIESGDELIMIGTARTQQGWVELFGRRYALRRGLVSYEQTPDPILDLELAYEFSAMTLVIAVTGTGEEPIVKLRAEPARYDESELLAFVLGASPDDPRPNEETAGGRATGIASSMLANRMQDLVSDVVPIDVLRIEMSDEQATAEKVTVGKWLTRKLFLAYRHRFTAAPDENSGEATIEYRFWRRWLLEAFYGDRGVGGADLMWIKRY